MNSLLISFLLFFSSFSKNLYGLPEVNDISTLSDSSYEEFLNSRNNVIVLFYSSSDSSTTHLFDQYSKFSAQIQASDEQIAPVMIDMSTELEIRSKYNFAKLPKIALFTSGKMIEFDGQIIADDIYDWLVKVILKTEDNEVKSIEQLNKISKLRFSILVKFPKNDYEQWSQYSETVKLEPDISFFYTHEDYLIRHLNVNSDYAIVVFRDFDDGMKIMTSETLLTENYIRQFINMFKNPMIYPFSKEVSDLIYSGPVTLLIYFADTFTAANNSTFTSFAFQNRHKIKIYQCDFSQFACLNLALSVGHHPSETNSVFILENNKKKLKRFKLHGDLTVQHLTDMVDKYLAGLLSEFVKSENEPVIDDPLFPTVVRNTVTEKVIDSTHTVVLVAYNENEEWNELRDVLKSLLNRYRLVNRFSFYKFDASKNEHDNVFVTKLPQIFCYKHNRKLKPLVFLGQNNASEIEEFLNITLADELESNEQRNNKEL